MNHHPELRTVAVMVLAPLVSVLVLGVAADWSVTTPAARGTAPAGTSAAGVVAVGARLGEPPQTGAAEPQAAPCIEALDRTGRCAAIDPPSF